MFLLIFSAAAARGQELSPRIEDRPQHSASTQEPRSSASPSPSDGKPARRARGIAIAAVYLVVGIAMVGALLIALVMLWGARMRRSTRTRLPPTPPPDPLWHLKPRREPDSPTREDAEGSGPDRE